MVSRFMHQFRNVRLGFMLINFQSWSFELLAIRAHLNMNLMNLSFADVYPTLKLRRQKRNTEKTPSTTEETTYQ